MRLTVVLTITGMAIATYLTRAPLLFVLSRRPLPPRLRLWLRLVPLAVLPALAVPMILVPEGGIALPWSNPQFWGAVVVFACVAARLNLLASVACSVATVALLRHLFG
jgi:branched-subunit amino acid transport protein